ncbi:hypothetical protein AN639_05040 [Candidatus Epulonipiscium fishelsonii]|uniref:Uncharacterized protein n=1 Tax=Candidatus Epulonipiscium fishelsonii TaxID=77094 RepID=A0ACC8XF04_9FIRM|nr:hypothetical protein AN639_05040 [Epulopiscium sp. SCG-B05WGA-EpuloA1]ONI41964.1 hypothetical protein AN396_02515 [Epulopiscium sp. SCG-B11WGA-EpuloA1]
MLKTDELLAIAYHLIRGIDPYTNEKLPQDHLINNKYVYQLLLIAQNNILNYNASTSDLPINVGKTWSNEEDAQLRTEYENKVSIKEMSKIHGRTHRSIKARLNKLYPHLYKEFSSENLSKVF